MIYGPREKTTTSSWYVRLLGGFEVTFGDMGGPDEAWRSQSARGILAWLVLKGPTHREKLIDLFWPDFSYNHARANLCSMIRYARAALGHIGPSILNTTIHYQQGSYSFGPSAQWTSDAHQLRENFRIARTSANPQEKPLAYQRVLQLYRGELLPGFYYEWVQPLREEMRQIYLDAGDELAQAYWALGRINDVIDVCRTILEEEPTWESAHRLLMESYAALGRRDQVAGQYKKLRRALETHLDVTPSEQSQILFQRLTSSSESKP